MGGEATQKRPFSPCRRRKISQPSNDARIFPSESNAAPFQDARLLARTSTPLIIGLSRREGRRPGPRTRTCGGVDRGIVRGTKAPGARRLSGGRRPSWAKEAAPGRTGWNPRRRGRGSVAPGTRASRDRAACENRSSGAGATPPKHTHRADAGDSPAPIPGEIAQAPPLPAPLTAAA